ncbi:MAG TPA: hypothetical protein VL242_30305 [Sorangium sp.]|nr:hypothetical protein [Sorangium sp.]
MIDENKKRAEAVQKRLLDMADMLLQRVPTEHNPIAAETLVRAASTAYTAALRSHGDLSDSG